VDRSDVRSATPNEGTKALLDSYWSAVTDAPIAAGIAALYAYEGQVPEVATEKINGLRNLYGVDDPRTLGFFTVHSTLDVEHSGAERDMIASLATTEADEEAALTATRAALDAWWGFLSAVDA
jgi:pyrroloquinoline-quinone synthase